MTHTGGRRSSYTVLVEVLREKKDKLEDLDVHTRIILKCIFKQWDGETWTGLI
jgi:hypothetical protein